MHVFFLNVFSSVDLGIMFSSGGLSGILCFRVDLHACLGPAGLSWLHPKIEKKSSSLEELEVIGMA